jgi:hypothetical protein
LSQRMKPKSAAMNGKVTLWFLAVMLFASAARAQQPVKVHDVDSSSADFDLLFNEMDALLDSLMAPRSFFLVNVAVSDNYFNYLTKNSFIPESVKKINYGTSVAYFSKSGLGIGTTVLVVNDGQHLNAYQGYVTGSYDYMKNNRFLTGFAFSHFFTKDSLPFYTSPLRNEMYAYFTYKKLWFKPCVAVSYGWGNRSDFEQREDYITSLRLVLNGFTRIDTKESITDFNVMTSVRHDFYWMNVLGKDDYIRLTPQVVFTSGTQRFGFNQTSSTYATLPRTGTNVLYSADNVYLDDKLYYQPLSLSTYIKTEYAKGKFFIQPQLVFDYYFPASDKKFTTALLMNAGVIF